MHRWAIHITTEVVSSNPFHGEANTIQHDVIKFVSDLRFVFNATFNNTSAISWRSVLLVEETGIQGENHRSVASHWQTLSHNVISSTRRHERGSDTQR
jgi:hypothetical protein